MTDAELRDVSARILELTLTIADQTTRIAELEAERDAERKAKEQAERERDEAREWSRLRAEDIQSLGQQVAAVETNAARLREALIEARDAVACRAGGSQQSSCLRSIDAALAEQPAQPAQSFKQVRADALEEAAKVVEGMPVQIYRDEGIGAAGRSCKPATWDDAAAAIRALKEQTAQGAQG